MSTDSDILHATAVAIAGKGVLITGPSGAGKSSLALELIARGAGLVADDRTSVQRKGAQVIADVPDAIKGMIEARGVGLIKVPAVGPVPLHLVIDMGVIEKNRLPPPHASDVLGISLPCLHKSETPHFPSAIFLYIRGNL